MSISHRYAIYFFDTPAPVQVDRDKQDVPDQLTDTFLLTAAYVRVYRARIDIAPEVPATGPSQLPMRYQKGQ
ncbi:hypothetical protein ACVZDH_18300 [Escherichia coli]